MRAGTQQSAAEATTAKAVAQRRAALPTVRKSAEQGPDEKIQEMGGTGCAGGAAGAVAGEWNPEEDAALLLAMVEAKGPGDWTTKSVTLGFGFRSPTALRKRYDWLAGTEGAAKPRERQRPKESDLELALRLQAEEDAASSRRVTRPRNGTTTAAVRRAADTAAQLSLEEEEEAGNDAHAGNQRGRASKRRRAVEQAACGEVKRQRTEASQPRVSQFVGVTYNTEVRKWQANLKAEERSHYLGVYEEEEDAARAWDAAARLARGAGAHGGGNGLRIYRLNFPTAAEVARAGDLPQPIPYTCRVCGRRKKGPGSACPCPKTVMRRSQRAVAAVTASGNRG